MDTESHFTNEELIEKLCSSGINYEHSEDVIEIFSDYVETSRHLVEVNQLFDQYVFNFCSLHHYYEIFFSDEIKVRTDFNFLYNVDHGIAINSLTNNLISSSITLINGTEAFLKELSDKDFIASFDTIKKNWSSRAYDNSFHYRFFSMLRHFMQHNHLSVSTWTDNIEKLHCCFDLAQILNTPHFNMHPKTKEELDIFSKDMEAGVYKHTRLSYSLTLAQYHTIILELYCQYLDIIDEALKEIYESCQNYIASNEDVICKAPEEYKGWIYYRKDNEIHTFQPSNNFYYDFYINIKKRSLDIYKHALEDNEYIQQLLSNK